MVGLQQEILAMVFAGNRDRLQGALRQRDLLRRIAFQANPENHGVLEA
jgi:hypothetical protein